MNRKLVLALTLMLLVGTLGLSFKVQRVEASGTIYIRADGSVDPPDAPISTVDDVTYILTGNITSDADGIVVERNNIIIDGDGYTVQGSGSGNGFYPSGMTNVAIKNAHIRGFLYGIYLWGSFNNMISGNNITANTHFGICMYMSLYNRIFGNSIAANGGGIWLGSSSNNIIDGNSITDSYAGISIGADGSSNKIERNNIANNLRGIEYLGEGSNNIFCHNNFANNTQQVYSLSLSNIWDNGYPLGGNYWSDYTDDDLFSGPYQNITGSDGIGDTSYIIDANNQDRYPLMYCWSPLPVHNINTGLGYAMIQEAIDANETLNGHTIFVEAGTYYENVKVYKSLNIVGEESSTTFVSALDSGDDVFYVTADFTSISGFTIQGATHSINSGIRLHASNCNISNNLIANNFWGILLYYSSHNSVIGNTVTANSYDGVLLYSSSDNTISGNFITASSMYGLRLFSYSNYNVIFGNSITNNEYGIWLSESSNNIFRDNNMADNIFSLHVWSSSLSDYVQDVDVSNVVDGKPVFYWINKQDLVVPADAGYVALVNCTNITVKNLNPRGILLAYTKESTIVNNEIADSGYGVYFAFSFNNSIVENNITNNEYGIWFDFPSSNNVISKNNITASNFSDIWLSGSSNNTISGNNVNNGKGVTLRDSYDNSIHSNDITNNEYGIVLWYSSANRVYRNSIRNSRSGGVLLTYSSNNNLSENKVIASNNEGIWLEFSSENTISGNYLENNKWGIHLWYSSNNEIYHNNFVHNTKQVWSEESINVWDGGYPSGGNYWSDYVGVDVNSGFNQDLLRSDGMGDTSHIIDVNNTDRYPLIAPITIFEAGTWNGVTYNVNVVSNSTVSGLQFNPSEGALLRFNVTGEDGTSGFCRVTIPKDLLWAEDGQWIVLVGGVPITNYTTASDQSCTYLHFTYGHSTKTVQITGTKAIPELSSTTITPLLMILAMLATAFAARKIRKEARKLRVKPLCRTHATPEKQYHVSSN